MSNGRVAGARIIRCRGAAAQGVSADGGVAGDRATRRAVGVKHGVVADSCAFLFRRVVGQSGPPDCNVFGPCGVAFKDGSSRGSKRNGPDGDVFAACCVAVERTGAKAHVIDTCCVRTKRRLANGCVRIAVCQGCQCLISECSVPIRCRRAVRGGGPCAFADEGVVFCPGGEGGGGGPAHDEVAAGAVIGVGVGQVVDGGGAASGDARYGGGLIPVGAVGAYAYGLVRGEGNVGASAREEFRVAVERDGIGGIHVHHIHTAPRIGGGRCGEGIRRIRCHVTDGGDLFNGTARIRRDRRRTCHRRRRGRGHDKAGGA